MSSARANASARSRRASQPTDIPQIAKPPMGGRGMMNQQQQVQQQQFQQTPGVVPKISVSDAFGLMSLRLARVEDLLSNVDFDTLVNFSDVQSNRSDNAIMQNYDDLFETITEQLNVMEEKLQVLQTQSSNPTLQSFSNNNNNNESAVHEEVDSMKQTMTKSVEELKDMKETVYKLVLNLQSLTLETTKKLDQFHTEQQELIASQEELREFVEQLSSHMSSSQIMEMAKESLDDDEIAAKDDLVEETKEE